MISLSFSAPTGLYRVQFEPGEDHNADVRHGDLSMRWPIFVADEDGTCSGLTVGSEEIWGDVFWWQLEPGPPGTIDYYGNGVLVRTDREATQ